MKKFVKITAVLLCVALVLAFVPGCGKNAAPQKKAAEDKALPYFEQNNLKINYTLGQGRAVLENGGAYHNKGTGEYGTAPLWVDLSMIEEPVIENGKKTVKLLFTRTFDNQWFPSGGYIYYGAYFFYDYYSGLWLPDEEHFSTDDGVFRFEFESQGKPVVIEMVRHKEYLYNQPGCRAFWRHTFEITMPADYDGFVFAVQPEPDTYAKRAENIEKNKAAKDYCLIFEHQGYDHYNSLYCRIQ